jgi:hypothetical protein
LKPNVLTKATNVLEDRQLPSLQLCPVVGFPTLVWVQCKGGQDTSELPYYFGITVRPPPALSTPCVARAHSSVECTTARPAGTPPPPPCTVASAPLSTKRTMNQHLTMVHYMFCVMKEHGRDLLPKALTPWEPSSAPVTTAQVQEAVVLELGPFARVAAVETVFTRPSRVEAGSVRWLWHGTRDADPAAIMRDGGGLKVEFSRGGRFGRAIYFADSIGYAMHFAHVLPSESYDALVAKDMRMNHTTTAQLLLCEVEFDVVLPVEDRAGNFSQWTPAWTDHTAVSCTAVRTNIPWAVQLFGVFQNTHVRSAHLVTLNFALACRFHEQSNAYCDKAFHDLGSS